jgi:hypothetical protein
MASAIAPASVAGAKNHASSAGAKVTVASKLPSPLRLQVCEMLDTTEQVMGGGVREIKVANRVAEIYVNGVSKKIEQAFGCEVVGGYALTRGVDKDLWERWLADNLKSPMVTKGLIFAHEDHDRVADQARELKDVRSNMEPMEFDPADDPRTPRGASKIEHGVPEG